MHLPTRRLSAVLALAGLGLFTLSMHAAAAPALVSAGTLKPDCDRQCLYGHMDRYLAALEAKDPNRLSWAKGARYTENNVELEIGDGVWGTISGLGKYRLKFADVRAGQVGFFGELAETDSNSVFSMRMKVVDGKISEVEKVIVRINDFGALAGGINPFSTPEFKDKPILLSDLAPSERRERERLISVADGYFDTLQLNDGQILTSFHKDCNRVENGVQTTNNPAKPLGPLSALGCEAQFKLGQYKYDDRLRGRRFPLVDEERGLVLAAGFIDHAGKLGKYSLADGTPAVSPINRPHSFYLLELFKIVDGQIRQIEAAFITVPYNMPSPWDAN
jgi:hypothetical protein